MTAPSGARPAHGASATESATEPATESATEPATDPAAGSLTDPCVEREVAGERLRARTETAEGAVLDVFLTGTVFMDMIFTGLPALPPPGTELFTDGLGSAPGGVANIAVAMSRLGLKVGLAATFGDDMFGAYLWRTLSEQEGVDLACSRRPPGWPTPVTVSLAYASDRSMVTFLRPPPEGAEVGDELVCLPPRARTCFIDLGRPVPEWARRMRADGALVFADIGWDHTHTWPAETLDRLADVDVFLPNASEAMAYTRTGTPEEALAVLGDRLPVVVVKLGAAGAIAVDSTTGETARTAALPVRALDPTGAGDVFCAGFVFATLAGWPLAERLKFANLCAGLSVRHHSGSLGAPCWAEIAAFGESGEVADEILADYGFVVPYIPAAADDTVARAEPTLRDAWSRSGREGAGGS